MVLLDNLGMAGHQKITQEEQWKCFRFLDLEQNSIIKSFSCSWLVLTKMCLRVCGTEQKAFMSVSAHDKGI